MSFSGITFTFNSIKQTNQRENGMDNNKKKLTMELTMQRIFCGGKFQ